MKNLKRLVIPAFILLFISGPLSESVHAQNPDQKSIDINIHLEIGRKSKGCKGIGICNFTIDINVSEDILARLLPKEDLLQLEFPFDFAKKHQEQFENDIFIMEEDFKIPDEISKELGSSMALVIPEGKYQIERTKNSLIVNIPQQ